MITVASCGQTAKRAHTTTSTAAHADRFQARPVLAVTPAPCRAVQVPDRTNQCYSLGPVALDAQEVASATSSFQAGGDGYGVDIVLTADGLRRFNALAAQHYGQMPPTNEVALVVDGRVISAPAFQTDHFDVGGIRVSGSLTQDDARHIAAVIG